MNPNGLRHDWSSEIVDIHHWGPPWGRISPRGRLLCRDRPYFIVRLVMSSQSGRRRERTICSYLRAAPCHGRRMIRGYHDMISHQYCAHHQQHDQGHNASAPRHWAESIFKSIQGFPPRIATLLGRRSANLARRELHCLDCRTASVFKEGFPEIN